MGLVTVEPEMAASGTRRARFVAHPQRARRLRSAAVERAQGTVEYLGLLAVLAVLLGIVALVSSADAPRLEWARLLRSARHTHTPDERALRNPVLGALIASAAPSLVLERDVHGDDIAIPVSDACRRPGCAAYGNARCVLYVHVVRSPERTVLEYWTYYPRSQTDHLPLRVLQGAHHDDWEGLLVAFSSAGHLLGARGSAHLGWNGSTPWWDERRENWAPYAGVAYRAAGSHAVGLRRGDLDLAGDGWNGDLAVVPAGSCDLRAADRAARGARVFDPGAVAPWDKQAWSDPGAGHTGPPGSSPGAAALAARAWGVGLGAARVGIAITRLGALPL
jgi:hypothetical protein